MPTSSFFLESFKGLIGHAADLANVVRFRWRNPRSLTKFRQLNRVRELTGGRVCVETGTFRGATTARCAQVFDRVITIELSPQLAADARNRFRGNRNVEVIEGDAALVIAEVMNRADIEHAVVFLDGHYSGGITASGTEPEPALLELDILARHREKVAGIVIDDFRCFGEPGTPKKWELLRKIDEQFPTFDVEVAFDQVVLARKNRAVTG